MNPDDQTSKGSSALPLSRGLADPKSHRNSTGTTGKLVNIPVPSCILVDAFGNSDRGTRLDESWTIVDAVMARSVQSMTQSNSLVPRAREKTHADRTKNQHRCSGSKSHGLSGSTDVREFGKLVPYLRKKGCLLVNEQVAVTRALRLCSNNIGDRKSARTRTVTESCPVQVSEHLVQEDEGPVNGGGNYDPLKVA